MPTNAEIWQEIVELKKRMDTQEQQSKENKSILLSVQQTALSVQATVNGYQATLMSISRFLRWIGAVGTGILISIVASFVITHFVH